MSDDEYISGEDWLDFDDFSYNEAVSQNHCRSWAFSLALYTHTTCSGRFSDAHDFLAPLHRLRIRL